ncbi:MAG: lipase [Draconibacterium sp.]|nr:MAG: lipase [Draconibacterium sp.]
MVNRYLAILVFSLIWMIGFCQNNEVKKSKEFPKAIPTVQGVNNVKLNTDIMVDYTKDQVYVTRDGKDLHLQILTPKKSGLLPCIVFIQGSAWMKQDLYMGIPRLSKFASRGYIIASVEYRHTGEAPFPAQVQDAKTAIRFIRKNAKKLNVDPDNIYVWGDSSGGHTALFAGITRGNKELDTEEYIEYSDEVNGIIDFYGPTDIGAMQEDPSIFNHSKADSPEGLLIGKLDVTKNMDKAAKASPINYINKEENIPPILIAHGDMDRTVPFRQSDCEEMYDIIEAFLKKYRK